MGRVRVLVVEDDIAIRESLLEILHDEGYETEGAVHGADALERLTAPGVPKPNLVLLDLMMPIMDGRALRAEMLKRPELAAVPVVVISASMNIGRLGDELSAAAYLSKPLDLRQLLDAVREHAR